MVSVGEQRESADWLRLPCDSGLTCPVFSQVGFIACVREGAVGSWYKDQTVKGMGTGTCWEGSHQVRPHQYKRHAKQVDVRDTVPWSEMRASFYSNFGLAHADVCTMWHTPMWKRSRRRFFRCQYPGDGLLLARCQLTQPPSSEQVQPALCSGCGRNYSIHTSLWRMEKMPRPSDKGGRCRRDKNRPTPPRP